MFELRTPGVYVRNVEPVPSIEGLRTDVTAFIGIAERGPLHEAVHIDDWERFVERFGTFRPGAFLAYAVKAYFDNGGRDAWIVRVADPAAAAVASVALEGDSPAGVRAVIAARNEGVWGQRLAVRIVHAVAATTAIDAAGHVESVAAIGPGSLVRLTPRAAGGAVSTAFVAHVDAARSTLALHGGAALPAAGALLEVLVFSLTVYEDGRVVEHFPGLSPSPPWTTPAPSAVATGRSVTATSSSRVFFDDSMSAVPELPPEGDYALRDGRDGVDSLIPEHLVGFGHRSPELGLQCLDAIDQVALVAMPDAVARPRELNAPLPPPPPRPEPCSPCEPPAPAEPVGSLLPELAMPPRFDRAQVLEMQRALLLHCETHRDRFALLDPHEPALERSELLSWRRSFDSSHGAAYYPWLEVVDPLSPSSAPFVVPPCGHVAGCYAKTDLASGVHVVGANRALAWTCGPHVPVGDAEQAELNPQSINCIRALPGRGARIYGARTLSSDAALRYVNVRRLLMMIAEALEEQLAWAVFEPADRMLRYKVSLAITGFLRALHVAGAFAGESEADSYFVRCDEVTNPPEAQAQGVLHALVGVAIVRPAEFVLLTIGRSDERLEVEEGGKPWR